jgi:hypothetical protein
MWLAKCQSAKQQVDKKTWCHHFFLETKKEEVSVFKTSKILGDKLKVTKNSLEIEIFLKKIQLM